MMMLLLATRAKQVEITARHRRMDVMEQWKGICAEQTEAHYHPAVGRPYQAGKKHMRGDSTQKKLVATYWEDQHLTRALEVAREHHNGSARKCSIDP